MEEEKKQENNSDWNPLIVGVAVLGLFSYVFLTNKDEKKEENQQQEEPPQKEEQHEMLAQREIRGFDKFGE